jgi:hypothetical protein
VGARAGGANDGDGKGGRQRAAGGGTRRNVAVGLVAATFSGGTYAFHTPIKTGSGG